MTAEPIAGQAAALEALNRQGPLMCALVFLGFVFSALAHG